MTISFFSYLGRLSPGRGLAMECVVQSDIAGLARTAYQGDFVVHRVRRVGIKREVQVGAGEREGAP
jgi:hypothetical protein